MLIRHVKRADIPSISRLYFETVRRVNTHTYTAEKILAWAPRIYRDTFWQQRLHRYTVFVAEKEGIIIGFTELARSGEIDCFYVHHAYQHQGVGSALMARIEQEVRSRRHPRLLANVSVTAEPFFHRMGFAVVRRQIKIQRNRAFKQAVMEKRWRTRHRGVRTANTRLTQRAPQARVSHQGS